MKTSQEWWKEVKTDEAKFVDWLVKQHRGEVTAAQRIEAFAEKYAISDKHKKTLSLIAKQERQHASWVAELLESRGIKQDVSCAEEKYWRETLPKIESFETGAAVGAHAEKMRLERIRVIASDISAPEDVRETFKKILKDELFHEKAFRNMAGDDAMKKTFHSHESGLNALGLEI